MMGDQEEQFSLKWNNYQSNFSSGFHDLLLEEMMVDVTLAAEGKFLQAHKIVLSVCSSYFKELFKLNPCKHPIVILRDVAHQEMLDMLEFMYKGETSVKQEELPSFLKLAETLKIKGLAGEKGGGDGSKEYDIIPVKKKKLRDKQLYESDDEDFNDDGNDFDDDDDDDSFDVAKKHSVFKKNRKRRRVILSKHITDVNTQTRRQIKRCRLTSGSNSDEPLVQLVPIKNKTKPDFDDDDDDDTRDGSPDAFEQLPNDPNMVMDDPTEQMPQGGVDYQMIQTKRGRDMLLYDGYTFTQNRMCKDGMRWQCSYPKCKAFCRMSSAGWLTPYKTSHEHTKPSQDEIRRRILRMELKARAQSSGATPGEIIRNALPADEYRTSDQKACYTRCIQRFRKSLQKKTVKPTMDEQTWQQATSACEKQTTGDSNTWMTQHDKHLVVLPKEEPKPRQQQPQQPQQQHQLQTQLWQTHPDQHQQQQHLQDIKQLEQKNSLHTKMEPYVL